MRGKKESTWARLKKILGFGPDCKNEGSKLLNGECLCPEYYEGEFCEKIVCKNGAKANEKGTACICPDLQHYRGKHCQEVLCENGGDDSGKGYCDCLDNWYSGRYCENYSSPWGITFGVMAAILVLMVFVCVICRLWPCRAPPHRNRRRSNSAPDSRNHRSRRPRGWEAERNNFYSRRNARQNRTSCPRDLVWPPWPAAAHCQPPPPPVEVVPTGPAEQPPPYVDKVDYPPPCYEDVVRDSDKYPRMPPTFSLILDQENAQIRRQISESDERRLVASGVPVLRNENSGVIIQTENLEGDYSGNVRQSREISGSGGRNSDAQEDEGGVDGANRAQT